MKSWKNRWMTELDENIPELKPEILNAPIVTASETKQAPARKGAAGFFDWLFGTTKGKRSFACSLAAVAVVFCVCLGLLLRPAQGSPNVSAFALEINPKAAFSVNEDGMVTNVVALNSDADVMLSNEECTAAIIGKSKTDAARAFVDYAAMLGFVNLSEGDAVKVVGCDSEAGEVVDAVKGYFMDKGSFVVVLSEKQKVENFCDLGGFPACKTVGEAVESIANSVSIFSEREVAGVADSELADVYEREFGDEGRRASFKVTFLNGIRAVENGKEDIAEITAKNEEIEAHADNPNVILKDYWNVKVMAGEDYTEEFALLMEEMRLMLEKYEESYGVEIDSVVGLRAMGSTFTAEIIDVINALSDYFDFEVFLTHLDNLVRLFACVGRDIQAASQSPGTMEEYLSKVNEYFLCTYEDMVDKNRERYEQKRESISQGAYDNYINNVIAQYGSLEQYWQVQNN